MISGKPTSEYIMDTLVAEMLNIKTANGFFTDIRDAYQPDFGPTNAQRIAQAAQDGAVLLLWYTGDGESSEGNTRGGVDDICEMYVSMCGMVKVEGAVQASRARFAADVRRVMRSNAQRCYPGSGLTSNDYCFITMSAQNPTFVFDESQYDASTSVGAFYTKWLIRYRFPRATG